MSDTKPVKGVLLKTDGTREDVTVSGWKDIVGHLGCDYMTAPDRVRLQRIDLVPAWLHRQM